jgi:peptidoglycan glycosyltransferase
LTFFWSIINSDNLINRPDNLRKIINDRFVPRGEILDRKNNPILTTTGNRGDFSRLLLEPSLSTMVGYNHPFLGQSGLEASLDAYLRGSAGMPTIDIFWNQLIYARPPDGLDIRTTIDLKIQNQLIEILDDNQGSAVLMNAENGEILALWSNPSFNVNNIDEEWEALQNDENAALLNRVSQGSYEIGNLSSIYQYAYLSENSVEIEVDDFSENGQCAYPISQNNKNNFQIALINGCDTANQVMSELTDESSVNLIIQKYNWEEKINFELPTQAVELISEDANSQFPSIQLSPLQVARGSAAFSNEGVIPYPNLALAVNSPEQGWIIFATDDPIQILNRTSANQTASFFSRDDFPAWEITSTNFSIEEPIHWYVSGTLPNWQASPMIFVMTLENGNSQAAKLLGREIMQQILTSSD